MCKETNDKQKNEQKNKEVHKEAPTPIKLKTTFTLEDSNSDKDDNK